MTQPKYLIGSIALTMIAISAAAPMTVLAGIVTTTMAVTGQTALAPLFLLMPIVLGVFAVGYIRMSAHVPNGGAFYSYIRRGLGPGAAVGSAWVIVTSYALLQFGLYGPFGVMVAGLAGADPGTWWLFALGAWLLVTVLGLARIDINGRIITTLVVAEIVLVVAYTAANFANAQDDRISFTAFDPAPLLNPATGVLAAIIFLAYVGFEFSAVYAPVARHGIRTVRRATVASLIIIGLLYATAHWGLLLPYGADGIVDKARAAQENQEMLVFTMAGEFLGQTLADVGVVLFVTSVLAAMISFHNATARYLYALGREGVFPPAFGRLSARTNAPYVGSQIQSMIGFLVIIGYAVTGLDPMVDLLFLLGSAGGFGVLLVVTITALAVFAYFARNRHGMSILNRLAAPVTAFAALLVVAFFATTNFHAILGVEPTSIYRWLIPVLAAVVFTAGACFAVLLRRRAPQIHDRIGLGAEATGEIRRPSQISPGR